VFLDIKKGPTKNNGAGPSQKGEGGEEWSLSPALVHGKRPEKEGRGGGVEVQKESRLTLKRGKRKEKKQKLAARSKKKGGEESLGRRRGGGEKLDRGK